MQVGEKIWHSARINTENLERPTFAEPTEITTRFNYLTIMPAVSRGYMEVMKYGEDFNEKWVGTANAKAFKGKIKKGDVFWLDGDAPIESLETEWGIGCTATATVDSVDYVNLTMNITLTRNKSQVTE